MFTTKDKVCQCIWAFIIVSLIMFGLWAVHAVATPVAKAEPEAGCETVGWGINLFGNWTQRRTICDGPRRPDGTWERARAIWTPAGYVPRSTYCGTWSCSSSGGYWRDETIQAYEKYITSDTTLPPNEPGWLPSGTVILR